MNPNGSQTTDYRQHATFGVGFLLDIQFEFESVYLDVPFQT